VRGLATSGERVRDLSREIRDLGERVRDLSGEIRDLW
jgi:hypothetical protein